MNDGSTSEDAFTEVIPKTTVVTPTSLSLAPLGIVSDLFLLDCPSVSRIAVLGTPEKYQ